MEYFRIKNWDRYQHKDAIRHGRMPWVKFYTSILMDQKMQNLSPSEFGLWARLVLLVGEIGNKVPLDQRYLRACLAPAHFPKRLDLSFMRSLDLIEDWTAGLDIDEDKTKTQTKTFARTSAPKKQPTNYQDFHKKTGWVNPAQARLANNMEVAKRAMERTKDEPAK